MYEEEFPIRLAKLVTLTILKQEKHFPPCLAFFICEYLEVTPQEFFDLNSQCPKELHKLVNNLKCLSPQQLENISSIVEGLIHNK